VIDLAAPMRHVRRYTVIGLICAAIHNAIMFASNAVGMHYAIALVISFLALVPIGYALHSVYTFGRDLTPMRFLRFAGGQLTGVSINFALMVLFISGVGLGVPVATLLCTGLLFLWNYFSARWAILLRNGKRSSRSNNRAVDLH